MFKRNVSQHPTRAATPGFQANKSRGRTFTEILPSIQEKQQNISIEERKLIEDLSVSDEDLSEEESNPLPLFNKIHQMKLASWNKNNGLINNKGSFLKTKKR